jgi:hypothetical protein
VRSALLLLVACGSKTEKPPAPVPHEAALPDAAIDAAIDAPVLDPYPVRPLVGPFKSIAAYCASKDPIDEPGYKTECDTSKDWSRSLKLKKPAPPFDDARVFVVEGLDAHCQLGIRTNKDWYIFEEAVRCLGERAKSTLEQDVYSLSVDDEQRLLVKIRYEQSLEAYSPEQFERTKWEEWLICGIGPSGKPSCTDVPIAGTWEDHERGKQTKTSKFALTVTLGKDEITVEGDMSTLDKYMLDAFPPGSYALRFP